jgi:hypothetical protein
METGTRQHRRGMLSGWVRGGLLGIALMAGAMAEEPSGVSAPTTPPTPPGSVIVRSAPIFDPQGLHVHSSSVVECPNGDLLAVWFHGSGERTANDVVIQGARWPVGAQGWGPVFLAADTPGWPDCNPVVFLDGEGQVVLVWALVQANRWEHSLLKMRRGDPAPDASDPTGPPPWQWQDVLLLRPGERFPERLREGFQALGFRQRMWAEHAPPYERLIVMAAGDPAKRETGWMPRAQPVRLQHGMARGRFLLPLYSDGFNVGLVALSDDGGRHWVASDPIVGLGGIQPTLAERRDGTVVAYLRDSGVEPGRVQRSESSDGGRTWTVARDTEIPNPGSSLAVLGLRDGRWLMVLNDTESGRHRLAVHVSTDEGMTWVPGPMLSEAAPGQGNFGYPTAIQTRDGRVHVTYTHAVGHQKTIRHVVLDPSRL